MDNTHEYTHLIDIQEQYIDDAEFEQEELFEVTNEKFITEEELKHIHPDLSKKIHLQQ